MIVALQGFRLEFCLVVCATIVNVGIVSFDIFCLWFAIDVNGIIYDFNYVTWKTNDAFLRNQGWQKDRTEDPTSGIRHFHLDLMVDIQIQ